MSLDYFWKNKFRRRKSGEINIWRLQALFQNFRKILQLNNTVLEEMATLEQALGGEFIFDWNYLAESVRLLASKVHHITYNLNALTGNGYVQLYDTYQEIRTILDHILSGNHRMLTDHAVLPLDDIGWELEPLTGINLVGMAELQHQAGIRATGGFVVTSEGYRALLPGITADFPDEPGPTSSEVNNDLRYHFQQQLHGGHPETFTVLATRIDEKDYLVRDVATFRMEPAPENNRIGIYAGNISQKTKIETVSTVGIAEKNDDNLIEAYVQGVGHIVNHISTALKPEDTVSPVELSLYIRPVTEISVAGTVTTSVNERNGGTLMKILASPTGQQDNPDIYHQRRTYPFELVSSNIAHRPSDYRFPDNKKNTDQTSSGLARGSALIRPQTRADLAETSMIIERMLGTPATIDWELTADNRCAITHLFPAPAQSGTISPADIADATASATILCQGGQTVQAGVGAGRVIHVSDESAADYFPAGAIAVARYASPQLTPVLQRAAAVVTEYGSAAGHLATVARELRLPAVFGLSHALALLPQESEVTVHAGETTVYEGIIDTLVHSDTNEPGFSPFDREYRTLRRLLRFIMPLNLIDPESSDFAPGNCRSFHDIIHFCHEKAVDELAHFQERRPGLGTIRTNRMQLGVPMDIRVLDIGGGLTDIQNTPTVDDVLSQPFTHFLDGLLQPNAWNDEMPSLGLRDIFSAMPRSMEMLSAQPDSLGENLAIVGHDYINISLRLGYHFSVIDAHLGSDDTRNYVYFRFVGGLADMERRGRRARFIRNVLVAMDFKVSVKGDLVIGRKKSERPRLLSAALFVLGALTAFSKQRDTALHREEDVDALFSDFSHAFLPHYAREADSLFDYDTGS